MLGTEVYELRDVGRLEEQLLGELKDLVGALDCLCALGRTAPHSPDASVPALALQQAVRDDAEASAAEMTV